MLQSVVLSQIETISYYNNLVVVVDKIILILIM